MQTRRHMTAAFGGAILGLGLAQPSAAAPGVFTNQGYAIGGYDTASYWIDRKAQLGQVGFNHAWKDVNWIFANQANRDTFAANPTKYAPGFNGYCPFCLAGGKLVPGVGNFYDINKGVVYLLLSQRVKDEFIMRADYFIERATTYWAKLS